MLQNNKLQGLKDGHQLVLGYFINQRDQQVRKVLKISNKGGSQYEI